MKRGQVVVVASCPEEQGEGRAHRGACPREGVDGSQPEDECERGGERVLAEADARLAVQEGVVERVQETDRGRAAEDDRLVPVRLHPTDDPRAAPEPTGCLLVEAAAQMRPPRGR